MVNKGLSEQRRYLSKLATGNDPENEALRMQERGRWPEGRRWKDRGWHPVPWWAEGLFLTQTSPFPLQAEGRLERVFRGEFIGLVVRRLESLCLRASVLSNLR